MSFGMFVYGSSLRIFVILYFIENFCFFVFILIMFCSNVCSGDCAKVWMVLSDNPSEILLCFT